jgi:hypothetical protein
LTKAAEPQQTEGEQDHLGQQGREQQAIEAMLFDGRREEHDERTGRAADLKPAAAQRGDNEAADNSGIKPPIRRHARGDRNRHRQRQRHNRHRQAGDHVGAKIRKTIAFAQHRDQLRRVQFSKGRLFDTPQHAVPVSRFGRVSRNGRLDGLLSEIVVSRASNANRGKRSGYRLGWLSAVIPGWSKGPDLRCAIAHRGISRFRVRASRAPE